MPSISIAAGGTYKLAGNARRKALAIYVKSGTPVWGFQAVTTTPGSSEGIPLPLEQMVIFSADRPATFTGPLHFASADDAELVYTECV